MVDEEEDSVKLFGWDVACHSADFPIYLPFVFQLLPEVCVHVEGAGVAWVWVWCVSAVLCVLY